MKRIVFTKVNTAELLDFEPHTPAALPEITPEGKEAPKTSNSSSSAYIDTVEGELRSKAKRLA